MIDHSYVPVTVMVAMSEGGTYKTAIANSNWLQEERKHQEILKEIRHDKQLWTVKYINTKVQYPITNETQE